MKFSAGPIIIVMLALFVAKISIENFDTAHAASKPVDNGRIIK